MKVFLSLGSNISNREENLSQGIKSLATSNGVKVILVSPIYETEPLYVLNQNKFLNIVIQIKTKLSYRQLLKTIKNIEKTSGRKLTSKRYGPRIIDIDILTYGDLIVNEPNLTIPHSKVKERKFVLQPWSDIAKDYILPGGNVSVYELLKSSTDNSTVILFKKEMAEI